MRLFRTGIPSLDTQLKGGLPSENLTLILAEPGVGEEIFSYHIVVEGLKRGERVLYITTDYSKEAVLKSLKMYFKEVDFSNLEIIDFFSQRTTLVLENTDMEAYIRGLRQDYIGSVLKLLKKENYDRVILNNLTFYIITYEFEEVQYFLENLKLLTKIKDSLTVLLMTENMFDVRIETAVKHLSDAVIDLDLREVENEIQRRLKIIKLLNYVPPKNIMRYELTQRGIMMESLMRVV
ncbi:RecA-superfamily ATPases implicated in signal transduction [Archaeoglobus sulfaticallidus PM70-1]|uniref:RecA-superfamily ATPases implicated in signal transduction n=1 Tax=Archaeoglobus sulfaticallidus PM70-1 TaxID=387631 RepID=N0BLF9_9EURY|nr:RAD55 family ATPase [Archaeoglobus sulfaticallidus]AGK61015.1 RecA-superfamily ATPases implicated in signal transduction [Archaeoglobus sulfaticallidus PM70-1]